MSQVAFEAIELSLTQKREAIYCCKRLTKLKWSLQSSRVELKKINNNKHLGDNIFQLQLSNCGGDRQ